MKAKQELFLGPVSCASIYSALNDTSASLSISKEIDPIKKLTMALTHLLGGKTSKYGISFITSGRGRGEVATHAEQITTLLQGKFEFEVDHAANRHHFYLESGLPRGYYIEGLSPDDEKILNKVFLKQYLIISASEMKALGFEASNPRSAIGSLSKIVSVENRIVLTGKNGSVCVIAETEKLQLLKRGMPQPIQMSPAKAITILYHAESKKEEKYSDVNLDSLNQGVDDLKQLSVAFKKLSINCSVDSESKNLYVVALPEEQRKIEKIWEESLVEFDINMRQYLNAEIENSTDYSVTDASVARFLGNKNFLFLSGPAIITKDLSDLQKLRALRSEWLEIDNDYLKLLNLWAKKAQTVPERVTEKLTEHKIIPVTLPVEARESVGNVFKISIPGKYKDPIVKHCLYLVSEHSLEVTPVVEEILYQQTGSKEIKSALSILQKQPRLSAGFTTVKFNKTYIVFADKNDINKIHNWVRRPVSINPVYKTAVKLQAEANGASSPNFKSGCDFLKIICDHPYTILSKEEVVTDIKIDPDNLQKLNKVAVNYVLISMEVYTFIQRALTMWNCENLCLLINSSEFLISREMLVDIYEKMVPRLYVSTRDTDKVMTNPCFVGHDQMCDRSEVDEQKDHWYAFNELGKQIVRWKKEYNFTPLAYKPLDPLQYTQTLQQDQKLIQIQPLVDNSVATNTQSFMPVKSNSISGSGSGLNTELKGNSSSSSSSSSTSSSSSDSFLSFNRF